jgi:WD40 repeat protein
MLRTALEGHTGELWGLDFSPDGKVLASAGFDRTVRLWDVEKGAALGRPINHRDLAIRVAFSPDGKRLASASGFQQRQGVVIVAEAATGRIMASGSGQGGEIRGLSWHPDGRSLASGAFDGSVGLWDATTAKLTKALPNAKRVQAVVWHPSGQFLASNDHGAGAILIWDMRSESPEPRRIQLFPVDGKGDAWTHDVLFTPEGRHLIAANHDGTVSVLRLAELGQMIK